MKTTKEILINAAMGNPDAIMNIISLGMGVQSTALYLMSSTGRIDRADYAIFSDPGAEHPNTYEMLKWLQKWKIQNNGIPIIVSKEANLYEDIRIGQNSSGHRWASIPAFSESGGMIRRQCTNEYKIRPVIKETRKLHKLKPRTRMKLTNMWLGISIDEIQRMKESQFYNIKYQYPLISEGMTRADCIKFFKDNNLPVPDKSSCVFCPYHSNAFWKDIKKENGIAWKQAVEIDNVIRDCSKKGLRDKIYIHRSLKPLEEVDFNENQLSMFEDECEGYCGI